METVKSRLTETRLDHCLTEEQADNLLGAKSGYIDSIERDRTAEDGVSTKTLQRLLKIYPHMDVHWVVTGVSVFEQGIAVSVQPVNKWPQPN